MPTLLIPGFAPQHFARRRARRAVATAAAAGSALLLAAVSASASAPHPDAGAPAAPAGGSGITWHTCPPPAPDVPAPRDPRTRCGTLRVPLDYRRPSGETIDIAVSRLPATGPGPRRGVLLVNPGGPGTSGLDLPSFLEGALPPDVVRAFDLIGFDPRGVRNSSPLSCNLTEAEVLRQLPFPAPDGSIRANVAYARSAARRCAATVGPRLQFFTTANTARDMDRIRAALGESRLSYYGISDGTYLGAVYRSLFPAHVDRIVLDSSADPRRVWYGQWRLWAGGFDARFPDLADAAVADAQTLGFGTTQAQVRAAYTALLHRLDRAPVDVGGTVKLSGNVLRAITFDYSYVDGALPLLMGIWRAAADLSAGRASAEDKAMTAQLLTAPPAEPGLPADNSLAAGYATMCGDVAWSRDVATYRRNVRADRAAHPLTAGMPANIWPCAFWAYRPVEPPVAITGTGPRNVLILQNERDPATPLVSGLGMRRALGSAAAFVRVQQGGHVVISTPNPCVSGAVSAFLARSDSPRDLTCPAPRGAAVDLHGRSGPTTSR